MIRKRSMFIKQLLMMVLFVALMTGCNIYFKDTGSNLQEGERIFLQYADGAVTEAVYHAGNGYYQQTLNRTASGAFVTDGTYRWVPEYEKIDIDPNPGTGSFRFYNADGDWGKPTILPAQARVKHILTSDAGDRHFVALDIYSEDERKVDGRTHIYAKVSPTSDFSVYDYDDRVSVQGDSSATIFGRYNLHDPGIVQYNSLEEFTKREEQAVEKGVVGFLINNDNRMPYFQLELYSGGVDLNRPDVNRIAIFDFFIRPLWNEDAALSQSKLKGTGVTLTWPFVNVLNGATPEGYEVYQDGVLIRTTYAYENVVEVTDLAEGTAYQFEVRAKYNNGRVSEQKLNQTVVTPRTEVTVGFLSDGISVGSVKTYKGLTIASPADPTKAGYVFAGWYKDAGLTEAWSFASPVTADMTLYAKWLSNNANLSGLTLSSGTMNPAFAGAVLEYTSSVANSVSSLTVTATTANGQATMTVNGHLVESGAASDAISLNVGSNTISIVVTAQDGTTRTYTVTVTREAAPVIVQFETDGGTDVDDITVDSGTVIASPANPTKEGYVFAGWYKDTGLTEAWSFASPVTADMTLYAKWLSTNANVSGLTLSSGTMEPAFDKETLGYTTSVANSVASLTVTATTANGQATMTVNGHLVENGAASDAIGLNVGSNTISIIVTAQDGNTTKTYTVTVTREVAPVTVQFESGGGTSVDAITVDSGTVIASPANSTREGYVFAGWYKDAGLTETWSFASPVTADMTLYAKWLSTNANLSGLTLSSGTMNPAFVAETLTYTTSVANSVASLTVTATTSNGQATMTVNGHLVGSGAASDAIGLNVGSNTISIVVTAQDGTTRTYTINVKRDEESSTDSPSDDGSDNTATIPSGPIAPTVPNPAEQPKTSTGEKQLAIATATTSEQDGQTVLRTTVDAAKLVEQLEQADDKSVVMIQVDESTDKVIVALTGDAVKAMESKHAILEVQTPIGTYRLPTSEISIEQLSAQLGAGIDLANVALHVDIAKSDQAKVELLADAADKNKFAIVIPPIDFTITAGYGQNTVKLTPFQSFVELVIPLPEGTDIDRITTAVALNEDGTTRSVPTQTITRDGKVYAVINSLPNSTYSVVWNPITFEDVEQHWAKDAVNEMASRMVLSGTGDSMFTPDREVTRSEFAAIVVRGLGLYMNKDAHTFSDVKTEDWYNNAISTAYAYGLISGFEDGSFRPNDKITREQAMVIIDKAMTITKLSASLPEQSTDATGPSYADMSEASTWAISSIEASLQAGILNGKTETELMPRDHMTRAEIAIIIQRLLQKSELI
jgi:uncharacterized repeat protein (TIGR02543 family)